MEFLKSRHKLIASLLNSELLIRQMIMLLLFHRRTTRTNNAAEVCFSLIYPFIKSVIFPSKLVKVTLPHIFASYGPVISHIWNIRQYWTDSWWYIEGKIPETLKPLHFRVCLSVCTRATEHTFWPKNLIFGSSDPWDTRKKRIF